MMHRGYLLGLVCLLVLFAQAAVALAPPRTAGVTAAVPSFDNRHLFTGDAMGVVMQKELPTLTEPVELTRHSGAITALAVSYDGRYLLSAATDRSAQLRNLKQGNSVALFGHTGRLWSVAFSSNNRRFATAGEDGTVRLYDLESTERLFSLEGHEGHVRSIAFSPDSRLLASGGADGIVRTWDVASGKLVAQFAGHQGLVSALAFSYDGKRLVTAGYDQSIRSWDISEGKAPIVRERAHTDWITSLAVSLDGQYVATAGLDQRLKIWTTDGLSFNRTLAAAHELTYSLRFLSNGRSLTVADGAPSVRLHDTTPLSIVPYRVPDLDAPSVVLINPRLVRLRGNEKKAVVYKDQVRVILQVVDSSGVKEVRVNGELATALKDVPNQYEALAEYTLGAEFQLVVRASDRVGNTTEESVTVERKEFAGSVEGRYHALFIAAQDYLDPAIVDLDNPKADAERLASVLKKNYSFVEGNVRLLVNPTRAQLIAAFDELQSTLDKNDNLLLFYAGHGVWDEELQQGFWLPIDATQNNRAGWVSNSTLRDYVGGFKSKHILLITDACFSGGIFKSRAAFINASSAIEEMYKYPSRKAMTSGALKTVPDKSVFLDLLIKRLDDNQETFLSSLDLFTSFRNSVINNSSMGQIPQFGEIGQTGDEGGDFIFVRKPEDSSATRAKPK